MNHNEFKKEVMRLLAQRAETMLANSKETNELCNKQANGLIFDIEYHSKMADLAERSMTEAVEEMKGWVDHLADCSGKGLLVKMAELG